MKKRPLLFVIVFLTAILLSCPPASAWHRLSKEEIVTLADSLKPGEKISFQLPDSSAWKTWPKRRDGSFTVTHGINSIYTVDNRVPALFITLDKDSAVESFAFIFRFSLVSPREEIPNLSASDSVAHILEREFGVWRYYIVVGGNMANRNIYTDRFIFNWVFGEDPFGKPGGYFKRDYLEK